MHRVETCVLDTVLGGGSACGRVQVQVGEAARLGPTAAYQKKKKKCWEPQKTITTTCEPSTAQIYRLNNKSEL